MTKVYIVTIKYTGEIYYFTSISAIFKMLDYSVLRIKYTSVNSIGFNNGVFKSKYIRIERTFAFGRTDNPKDFTNLKNTYK